MQCRSEPFPTVLNFPQCRAIPSFDPCQLYAEEAYYLGLSTPEEIRFRDAAAQSKENPREKYAI